ncbi:hypothetical protein BB560_000320 [Smittium megazygosporum]|uniref:Protein kinase domain-containing protein n=1 Tax=Smittium megazygosporum TaxID=133381 RepID=A0A2T9ZKM5_9FUNG|nr:hypothetical protein BB560_000320 [Smittium megazygosporum]
METYISKLKDFASTASRTVSSAAITTSSKISESIQGKIGRDYRTLDENQILYCGMWKLVPAEHVTSKSKVSLWIFDKKNLNPFASYGNYGNNFSYSDKNDISQVLSFLKAEVSQITRLRHPAILKIVEPIEDSKSSLLFVTEPVISSLKDSISSSEKIVSLDLDEIEIQRGLQQLIQGLQFLHSSGIVHTNINPSTILVDSEGDWKLFGFGYSTSTSSHNSFDSFSDFYSLPLSIQRNLEYSAPELILEKSVSAKNDVFSLGCLVYSLYNNGNSFISNPDNDNYKYENKLHFIKNPVFKDSIPSIVKQAVSSLVEYNPENRLSLSEFQTSGFFNNIYAQTLLDLENILHFEKHMQLSVFKQLSSVLDKFSPKTQVRKIHPKLNSAIEFIINLPITADTLELIYSYVVVSFLIAKHMSTKEFTDSMLPCLLRCIQLSISNLGRPESVNVTTHTTILFLQKLDFIKEKCTDSSDSFNSIILPTLFQLIDSGNEINPKITEIIYLESIPSLSKTMDKYAFNNTLCVKVLNQYKTTNKLLIKVMTIRSIAKVAQYSNSTTVNEHIIPTLIKTKSRNMDLVSELLNLYNILGKQELVQSDFLFKLVIPHCFALLYETKFSENLFSTANSNVRELCELAQNSLKPLKDYQPPVPLNSSSITEVPDKDIYSFPSNDISFQFEGFSNVQNPSQLSFGQTSLQPAHSNALNGLTPPIIPMNKTGMSDNIAPSSFSVQRENKLFDSTHQPNNNFVQKSSNPMKLTTTKPDLFSNAQPVTQNSLPQNNAMSSSYSGFTKSNSAFGNFVSYKPVSNTTTGLQAPIYPSTQLQSKTASTNTNSNKKDAISDLSLFDPFS